MSRNFFLENVANIEFKVNILGLCYVDIDVLHLCVDINLLSKEERVISIITPILKKD